MEDRAPLMEDYHRAERKGTLDQRDPVEIAGDDSRYVDMEIANSRDTDAGGMKKSTGGSLKHKIGSLRHRKHD